MNTETIALSGSEAAPARRDARIRVLDITKFYSHASGGVRTYLDMKVADFSRREVAHTLVIPGESPSVSHVGNTRIYRTPGPVIPLAPNYRILLSSRAIERIIQIEQPDVIEVGSPFLVPLLVRRAIGRRGIPTVGFYHSDLVRTYAEPYVTRRALAPLRVVARNLARLHTRTVYGRFDITVAASPTVTAELRALGIQRVHTVSLGVDLDVFSPLVPAAPLRDKLGIPKQVPLAIFAGRFCPEKRLDVVLRAHAGMPEDQRPHLVLIGEGMHDEVYRAEASKRSRLSVLPFVHDRRELAALLVAADFYIASGPGETFGLAIAEALACGLPVVSVDEGAAPDRVAGSPCGRLYRHGDADSCREALRSMINALSPGLRAAARDHAERHYSWRRTFDSLIELYTTLAPVRR